MIDDDTTLAITHRRAYDGFCPEKQSLLTQLRHLRFKNSKVERQQEIVDRLMVITFVPEYPGEPRSLNLPKVSDDQE